MDHPVIGPARFEGNPFQFSSTASDNWRSAPLLGEDNEYVFKQIVGLDDEEFERLTGRGRADDGRAPPTGSLECGGLRVVELAGDPAGEMLGKLLAELGADVIKVEPPAGSPTRTIGPFAGGHADGDHSLTFWYYNTNKRSVVIDDTTDQGRADLMALLADGRHRHHRRSPRREADAGATSRPTGSPPRPTGWSSCRSRRSGSPVRGPTGTART